MIRRFNAFVLAGALALGACANAGSEVPALRTSINADEGGPRLARLIDPVSERGGTLSSVIERLEAGEAVRYVNAIVMAEEPTQALFTATSSVVAIAVLSGRIVANGKSAGAGEVLYKERGGRLEKGVFDARSLLASNRAEFAEAEVAALEDLADNQASLMFWGLLEEVGSSGIGSANEDLVLRQSRNRYLASPTVMQILHDAPNDYEALAIEVARTFGEALSEKDVSAVAALTSPWRFVESVEGAADPKWIADREAYAASLVEDPKFALKGPVNGVTQVREGVFEIQTPERTLEAQINYFDQMVFVLNLKPQQRYMQIPVVVEIFKGYSGFEELAPAVADRFGKALAERDVDTIEALLSPWRYVGSIEEGYDPSWMEERRAFAEALAADPALALEGPIGAPEQVEEGRYRLAGKNQVLEVQLNYFDEMVFVLSIEAAAGTPQG